ncbi:hypothetical protein [Brasilonema sp. UFV-L1]|uniref:hypothetical protein n=1 Tax=Brasilonema sp. UFV-L1 TaxID=2234130 RepID=UPI00145C42FF|nr:hypothetical protein [Brasilonema sp. UFV-L1]NMG10406.1 hypothetical protein [Brasilonema sp. UFV-L1]
MATDYIMFIHGVNNRYENIKPYYADKLFHSIQNQLGSTRTVKPVVLYWGEVGEQKDKILLNCLEKSTDWNKLWFREFRRQTILPFIGDGALYTTRYEGAAVVAVLVEQALDGLKDYNPQVDRLHLVTHSWGTIILFDVLFAERWDDENKPGYDSVKKIRENFFGIEPNLGQGLSLASIYTMGSPIPLFYRMNVDQSVEERRNSQGVVLNSHDITPRLEKLLDNLYQKLKTKLPWRNFIHAGDPLAFPLNPLLPELVDEKRQYIEIEDIVTKNKTFYDFVTNTFSQTTFSILHGRTAHSSYWQSQEVAQKIAEVILQATSNSEPG